MAQLGDQENGSPPSNKGKTLASLVQQIGEIIQQGEDSVTPTQHTEAQEKLRSIFLTLLDVSISASHAGTRHLAGVLQLLALTLGKVPGWLSGENNSLLLEILDRITPLLTRRLEAKAWSDFALVVTRTFLRIAATDYQQFAVLVRNWYGLFEKVCGAAITLAGSVNEEVVLRCSTASSLSLAAADSKKEFLALTISDLDSCEHMLATLSKLFIVCTEAKPFGIISNPPSSVIICIFHLLNSTSLRLQAAAMQWLAVLLRMSPSVRCELRALPERIKLAIRHVHEHKDALVNAKSTKAMEEWHQSLLTLLNTMVDSSCDPLGTCFGGLSIVSELVAFAFLNLSGNDNHKDKYCILLSEIATSHIEAMDSVSWALSKVHSCSAVERCALLEAVRASLGWLAPVRVSLMLTRAFGSTIKSTSLIQNTEQPAESDTVMSVRKKRRTEENDAVRLQSAEGAMKQSKSQEGALQFKDVKRSDRARKVESSLQSLCFALNDVQTRLLSHVEDPNLSYPAHNEAMHLLAEIAQVICLYCPEIATRICAHALEADSIRRQTRSGGQDVQPVPLSDRHSPALETRSGTLHLACAYMEAFSRVDPAYRHVLSNDLGALEENIRSLCLSAADSSEALTTGYGLVMSLWIANRSDREDSASDFIAKIFKKAVATSKSDVKTICGTLLPLAVILPLMKFHNLPSSHKRGISKKMTASTVLTQELASALQRVIDTDASFNILQAVLWGIVVITRENDVSSMITHASYLALHRLVGFPLDIENGLLEANYPQAKPTIPSAAASFLVSIVEQIAAKLMTFSAKKRNTTSDDGLGLGEIETTMVRAHLIDAMAGLVKRSTLDSFKLKNDVAAWFIAQGASENSILRRCVLLNVSSMLSPQIVVSAYDNSARGRSLDVQEWQRVAGELGPYAMKEIGTKMKDAGYHACSLLEDCLQLIAYLGIRYFNVASTRSLAIAMLVLAIDQRDAGVAGFAAEALKSIAKSFGTTTLDLILNNDGVPKTIISRIASSDSFLQEVADVVGLKRRTLAASLVPITLESLLESKNTDGLKSLAAAAGMDARQVLKKYGHIPFASILIRKSHVNIDRFMTLSESWSGEDFVTLSRSLLPQTLTELVAQAGAASEWCEGEANVSYMIYHIAKMVNSLAEIAGAETAQTDLKESPESRLMRATEFLTEGDHITRMLKEFGDQLNEHLDPVHADTTGIMGCANGLRTIRAVIILLALSGRVVGRFLPQFMVLFGASVRCENPKEIKLQGLEGWKRFVEALSRHATIALGGVVDQIVVTLLDSLQEPDEVGKAAVNVVQIIIDACKKNYPNKLRTMPPLPQWPEQLKGINSQLQKARGDLTTSEQVMLLLESLDHEALIVRSISLKELKSLLSLRREWLCNIQRTSATDPFSRNLLRRLTEALLKCTEFNGNSAQSKAAQQACAECLGILGATDPTTVALKPPPKPSRATDALSLAKDLMLRHLLRLLKTAPTLQDLDFTTLAIQDVLRCHGGQTTNDAHSKKRDNSLSSGHTSAAPRSESPHADSNALFSLLPDEIQALVRPYLYSRYSIQTTKRRFSNGGVIFYPGITFRRWIGLWLTQLIDEHCCGAYVRLFKAVNPVLRIDVSTAMFMAPYIIRNAVASSSSSQGVIDVSSELLAVLGHHATSRDGLLCIEAAFSLLDTLHGWHIADCTASMADSNAVKNSKGSILAVDEDKEDDTNARMERLFNAIPKDDLARAASTSGAHARALLYYETYVRETRGGGSNPAAALTEQQFEDQEVSFLLEIYSKLEEPDGLDGLIKLRRGIPQPGDQRLAAEKSGSWAEALTLYERELSRLYAARGPFAAQKSLFFTESSQDELPALQAGHLNCLLEMGHWQGLLTQVEGLAANASRAKSECVIDKSVAHLASMGTAAAWRLGRWRELDRYLSVAKEGFDDLGPDARWEVRIGALLQLSSRMKVGLRTSENVVEGQADEPMPRDGTKFVFEGELALARAEVMEAFSAAAMESYSRAYPQLVKLHMLQEVSDAMNLVQANAVLGPIERRRSLRWDQRIALTQRSLTTQAPILALRRQLAELIGSSEEAGQCWLQHAQLCRDTGHLDAAVPAVLEATRAGVLGATLEQVQLFYVRGEHHRAISELQNIESMLSHQSSIAFSSSQEPDELIKYRASVLLRLAELMAETGQGTSDEVIQLFEHALQLREGWEKAHFQYAAYLDQLMQDAKARQEVSNGAGDSRRTTDRLGGRSRIRLGEDRPYSEFLPEVMRNYVRSIVSGHTHVHRALPRLLTLWYDFGSEALVAQDGSRERAVEPQIMEIMRESSRSVPIHCWMTALPQLISRLLHRHADVSQLTRHLITQATINYPQQSLWALAVVSKSAVSPRRVAANGIIANAKRAVVDPEVSILFSNHNSVCEQLIKVCHQNVPPAKRQLSVKRDFRHLHELLRRSGVMVPIMANLSPSLPPIETTHTNAWQPFGKSCVVISDVDDVIDIMSSLQRPKRIVLIGSDGQEYPFLAKPKDDLRKDNRMMEASGVLNRLFQEEPASRRRGLKIRRFAVTPITEDCGIVEWVGDTKPVRHCIQDIVSQYMDLRQDNAKIKLLYDKYTGAKTRSTGAGPVGVEALLTWLEQVLKTHPPVFHKWFLGKFPEPAAWFNSRLAYTRTYAVWCMVGHITGLGDRHGENVLIDMTCGDAIQIDFGCLFDRGLVLEKPEMVPFRLTQNIIDAFGVAGLEGVFRKSCETTLGVLRKHRDTIMPIMETFLHDPLVDWQKKSRSSGAINHVADNPMARDALMTIDGRLRGTLLGVASRPCMAMSVAGHAASLIQEAVNKENLAKMYIWWQAWY